MATKSKFTICTYSIGLATTFLFVFPQPFKTKVNAQSANLSASYIGVWEGTGSQSSSSWTISITLTPGTVNSVVGTIAYPSLSCGGTLTLHRIKTQSIELDERFTYGSNRCVPGRVILQSSSDEKNQLEYSWLFPDGRKGAAGSVRKIVEPINPVPSPASNSVASVNGKYSDLIQVVNCPSNRGSYGEFYDWGYWSGTYWCGQSTQPGYWVWANPNWYIWRTVGTAKPAKL
jgi:hypothetical protein